MELIKTEQTERILELYRLFKRAMQRNGRMISFPKKTDPTKTYCWRYLANFLEKADELELGDEILPRIVDAVVAHAKEQGLLHRGIAVLDQKDLFDVCYARFERDARSESNLITEIRRSYDFVRKQQEQNPDRSVTQLLSKRPSVRAYANIVSWHKAGYITLGYITVSKACRRALAELQEYELALLPSSRELLRLKIRLVMDKEIAAELRVFMGNDLFQE
jgi:hypothetical protein